VTGSSSSTTPTPVKVAVSQCTQHLALFVCFAVPLLAAALDRSHRLVAAVLNFTALLATV
jgi:hypothetical protein